MNSSRLLAMLALAACVLASCARDSREPADRTDSSVADPTAIATGSAAVWEPADDYWQAYRAVLVIASCDSAGEVESTELLYSYASPAESDSALQLVSEMRFDPKSYAGRIREDGIAPKRPGGPRFIVPIPTRGGGGPPPDIPSREDLERAGLGPWLALCDSSLPGWPYETWAVTTPAELYRRHPNHEVEDAQLRAAGLVSRSPDGRWGLHPFHGVPVEDGWRLDGRDADGGFVLYRSDSPGDARQLVVGPGTWFFSAHWIDAERYVVTSISERGLSLAGMWTGYQVPELLMGHADSMNIRVLGGPPFPPELQDVVALRFQSYQDELYPRIKQ